MHSLTFRVVDVLYRQDQLHFPVLLVVPGGQEQVVVRVQRTLLRCTLFAVFLVFRNAQLFDSLLVEKKIRQMVAW